MYDLNDNLCTLNDSQDDSKLQYQIHRFILEPCTYVNGVLSDNKFHQDKHAWFAEPAKEKPRYSSQMTYLSNAARCTGINVYSLILMFCSADPLERANAYWTVGECYGFDQLDNYPLTLNREEAEARLNKIMGNAPSC